MKLLFNIINLLARSLPKRRAAVLRSLSAVLCFSRSAFPQKRAKHLLPSSHEKPGKKRTFCHNRKHQTCVFGRRLVSWNMEPQFEDCGAANWSGVDADFKRHPTISFNERKINKESRIPPKTR